MRALEDHDLAALRNLLLAKEQGQIRKILHRLDDPATRAEELARILPQAFALRSLSDDAMTDALLPAVRDALGDALKQRPDLLLTAMRSALLELFTAPFHSFAKLFRRRRKSSVSVRAQLLRVEQYFLLQRSNGKLLQHSLRPSDDAEDLILQSEQRSIASMITYLLSFLRDPEHLAKYAEMGHLRIEHLTYGIHVSEKLALVSVIRSPIDEMPVALLQECCELVEKIEKEHGAEIQSDTGLMQQVLPRFAEMTKDLPPELS